MDVSPRPSRRSEKFEEEMIIMPNTIERLNEELRRIRGELQQVKKPKK